ncbi:hypothetical protein DHW03_17550 [Pedobacter yonginense]|uniref:Uncharacterized protein n=1 Tax=Pedobacter yonginense TaxID=651869 RepID=A0A317EIV6_9SPHI|nr:hypothetical protein [Pedobacter yonginense]PWS26572.1 hypothetical protein DHW03_17550 [Pedobacter yonginense]
MRYLLTIIIIATSLTICFAQSELNSKEINQKIEGFLISNEASIPNKQKLKDSVDFYSFAIEICVKLKGKNTIIDKISVNDSIAYVLYKDFNFLRSINFTSVMGGKKQAVIVVPVGIIIAYVNHPVSKVPMLEAEDLQNKIVKMFNYDYRNKDKHTNDFIYLNPIVSLTGTKTYD